MQDLIRCIVMALVDTPVAALNGEDSNSIFPYFKGSGFIRALFEALSTDRLKDALAHILVPERMIYDGAQFCDDAE